MLFNNTDANATPPQLGFINQDVQSGWEWVFWQSHYNQTLTRTSLLNSFDILATTANWFDILPAGDLDYGRSHPLLSLGYVDPTWNNWWVLCMRTAQNAIRNNETSVINVGWSIPIYAVNHNTASVTETLSICKPHINTAPNVTWMFEVAHAANVSGSPRAGFLYNQAASQQQRIDSGLPLRPVVEWVRANTHTCTHMQHSLRHCSSSLSVRAVCCLIVRLLQISDVTFDPYALVVFMTNRLPSFVLDNGAAFICTTDGWILASTLKGADLSVLVYMPELLYPNTTELISYSQNVSAAHPRSMQFVWSLYNNMQSSAWQANINSVSLSDDSGSQYQLGWEQSEPINGANNYVQYAVLGVPSSGFSFVLVVYSRQSDYEGGLVHNAQLSGALSAVVIVVSLIVTLLITQSVTRPLKTLISAMKAVLGENPWQKTPAPVAPISKAGGKKVSQHASFAVSTNKAPAALPPPFTLAHIRSTTDDSPDTQQLPSSPLTDQLTPLPVALPSPSRLTQAQKSGEIALLDNDFLRTSSSSTATTLDGASPFASIITRTISDPAVNGSSPTMLTHSIGQWKPIEAQPPVYTKYVPDTAASQSNDIPPADKAVSIAIYNPPPPPLPTAAAAAAANAKATTVHYATSISTDEPSANNQRQSRSGQLDDSSSYEIDLLLQKWQRTMLAQGVRLPAEWETDLQEDAQRLRELRMGLREARKRYQGRRRKQRTQLNESGAGTAGPAGSDDEDDEEDQSVFTPNDGRLSALAKLSTYLRDRLGRPATESPKSAEHSLSHQSMSTNSNSSNHSTHPLRCDCTSCQLYRFTNRLVGCAGNFSEVVQLQLTFGAMLFRLRNSALKLEQANQSKRQFLRFVFHEVRVPLNALGLGVEQLYEIGTSDHEKREAHSLHLVKQQEILNLIDDELHSVPCSSQSIAKLMMQLDQLLFDCPLCAASTPISTPPQTTRLSSGSIQSSFSTSSNSDATSLSLLNIVQDQVATVTRILNDVLSLQRIEDGELKMEMVPFNVCTMIENTLHSFQAEFRQKQLRVKTEYRHYGRERELTMAGGATYPQQDERREGVTDSDVRVDIVKGGADRKEGGLAAVQDLELQVVTRAPTPSSPLSWFVSADQYRLRQVISNFVSNAVKFSRQAGSITILATLTPNLTSTTPTSTVAQHRIASHFLELAVRDSGIGISPAGLRSLFQPYSQIRPGALQEGKGSGLGLSICKKLVELHGGRVVVSSTPGEGSTFSLGVPVEVMREVDVKEMLRQQGGSSRSAEILPEDDEEGEGEDEQESKQLEGMDEEALRDGLYKYQNSDAIGEGELTTAAAPTVVVPPIVPPEESPVSVPEGARRATSNASSAPLTSPAAFTPTTIKELVAELPAPIITSSTQPQPSEATITTITSTASTTISQSVRLPSRRLAPTAASHASNTPPGLGTGAGGRRKVGGVSAAAGGEVLRALVVEDSAVNRKLLVMMIEKMGLTVDSAEDGQYALDLITNHIKDQQHTTTLTLNTPPASTSTPRSQPPSAVSVQYDVIFMDDHMPRCTGVECVAQLRALGVSIPIFGITANALLEDQQRFVKAGVTAVVTKPMQKKQLVDMIATVRKIKEEQKKMLVKEKAEGEAEQ